MRCCTGLCERRGTCLAQSMSRTMMQIRLVTPITHGVAEPSWSVRFPVLGNEEGQVFRTPRRNRVAEIGMQGNVNLDRGPVLVLRLDKSNSAMANVLRTESNGVLAASTCVKE